MPGEFTRRLIRIAVLGALFIAPSAQAADFTVANGQTVGQQTLSDPGDIGVIETGGAISTAGPGEHGVYAYGDDETVTNRGDIATTGAGAFGIRSVGVNAVLTNGGFIGTLSSGASGIRSDGADASITNGGTIRTTGPGAFGVYTTGAGATVTNSGTIATEGPGSNGLYTTGVNAIVTNDGNIVTINNGAVGIQSTGGNAVLTSYGFISTLGNGSDGIGSLGDDARISNGGTIETSGPNAYGINFYGANAVVTNSGIISTTGQGSYGIQAAGDEAEIVNSGYIGTSGYAGYGIDSAGANAMISNTGTIETSNNAHAIYSLGSGATISNSGIISTSGNGGYGVSSQGADVTVTNSGTIATAGDGANGIFADGVGAVLTNDGTIRTTGSGSIGINSGGDDAVIVNTGSISTASSSGIHFYGARAIVTNTGTVATSGNYAYAIDSYEGDDAVVTNSGRITTAGMSSRGIYTRGSNATVINSGAVLSSGVDGSAIWMPDSDAHLTLLAGTALQGTVRFDEVDTATLTIGPGLQTALTLTGIPTTIDTSGQPYVLNGSLLAVVDPTGFGASDAAAFGLTRSIAGAVEDRLNAPDADALTTGAVPGGEAADRNGLWGAMVGSFETRLSADSTEGYRDGSAAMVVGYDRAYSNSDIVGGFAGLSYGGFETRAGSASGHATGPFAGAYWGHDGGQAFAGLSLTAGGLANTGERTIVNNLVSGGLETADADFGSFYVSPAVTFGFHDHVGGMVVSPSVRLRYTGLYVGGYSESGSTADMTAGDRTAQSFEARGQVRANIASQVSDKGVGRYEVRVGVDGVFTDNGTVDATLLGTDLSFATGADQWSARGFLGSDFTFSATDGMILKAGAEAGYDTTGMLSLTAKMSVHNAF